MRTIGPGEAYDHHVPNAKQIGDPADDGITASQMQEKSESTPAYVSR